MRDSEEICRQNGQTVNLFTGLYNLLNVGRAEDIAEHGETKAMELEKEIRVDANILKSLEASEQSNKEQIITVDSPVHPNSEEE